MLATNNQLGYIALKLDQLKNDYVWIKELFNQTPKNNEKYPDERANYQRKILEDKLSVLTTAQADYVIKAYNGEKGYHQLKARDIIIKNIKI